MKYKKAISILCVLTASYSVCGYNQVKKSLNFESAEDCTDCTREDHFTHLDVPLSQYSSSFHFDNTNNQIIILARQSKLNKNYHYLLL